MTDIKQLFQTERDNWISAINEISVIDMLDRLEATVTATLDELQKQVPKTARPFWCSETGRWRCPKDHNPLNRTYDKHCSTCGARLDWLEEAKK